MPITTETNYYKFSNLKQHSFVTSQFFGPKSRIRVLNCLMSEKTEVKMVTEPRSWSPWGQNLLPSSFRWLLESSSVWLDAPTFLLDVSFSHLLKVACIPCHVVPSIVKPATACQFLLTTESL